MGRAARKTSSSAEPREHWTDTHPDREMWSPGRLAVARTQTQEEYEALYGRGEAVESVRRMVASPLFPDPPQDILEKLGRQPISGAERVELLASMRVSRGIPEDDPVLGLLWNSEVLRIEAEIDSFRQAGATHWAEDVDLQELEKKWINLVGNLGQRPRSVLRRSEQKWWKSDAEGQEILRRQGSSLLQAAMYLDLVDREDIASGLEALRGSSDHDQFFADNVLWDPAWRKAYAAAPEVSESVWRSLGQYLDSSVDIGAEHKELLDALPENFRDSFERDPAGRGADSSIYDEALNSLDWNRVQDGDGEEEMLAVSRDMIGVQIMTIADQGEYTSSEKWHSYRQAIQEGETDPPFPLDNLRPLFEAADQIDFYEKLVVELGQKARQNPHIFAGDPLREALIDYFDPRPGLNGITLGVYESLLRKFV